MGGKRFRKISFGTVFLLPGIVVFKLETVVHAPPYSLFSEWGCLCLSGALRGLFDLLKFRSQDQQVSFTCQPARMFGIKRHTVQVMSNSKPHQGWVVQADLAVEVSAGQGFVNAEPSVFRLCVLKITDAKCSGECDICHCWKYSSGSIIILVQAFLMLGELGVLNSSETSINNPTMIHGQPLIPKTSSKARGDLAVGSRRGPRPSPSK